MKDTSTEGGFMQITTADDVSLEAEWHPTTADGQPRAVVVATHPHPLHGGDMHNTAPATLARALPGRAISVLRFNFRGVGSSTGQHDDGNAEHLDLHAALAAAAERHPDTPVVLAGYSFGADMALDFATDAPVDVIAAVSGIVAIAPPLRMFDTFSASALDLPKHLLPPVHDQFRPPEQAEPIIADWANTTIEPLAATDHFLLGATDQIVQAVDTFVSGLG